MVRLMTMLAACVLGGCSGGPPIVPPPRYAAVSDAEALAVIAERQAKVLSVSAECDLELTDENGQSVSLDGVLVAQPPGKLRLRAWKFGQAVFDLTLADGKGWVMVPDSGPERPREAEGAGKKVDVEQMPARRVSDAFELLGAGFFRSARVVRSGGSTIVARGTALGRDDVVCEIDRPTLTARRFVIENGQSELVLERYTLTDAPPVVWPMRMRLKSPNGEVTVSVRSVEVNGEVAEGAFVPPRRAVELP